MQMVLHLGGFKGGRKPFLKDGLGQNYRLLVPRINRVCTPLVFLQVLFILCVF